MSPALTARQFLRASAGAGLLRFAGLLLTLLLHLAIARLLWDQSAYGAYAWAQSLLYLVGGLLTLGIPMAVSVVVARDRLRPGAASFLGLQHWAERSLCRLGVIVLALGLGVALLAIARSQPRTALPWLALGLAPFVTLMLFQQQLGKALERLFWAYAPSMLMRPLLALLLVFACWSVAPARLDPTLVLLCLGASVLVSLSLQRAALGLGGTRPVGELPDAATRRTLRRSARGMYWQRIAATAREHGGTLLVGAFVSLEAAALFFAADRIAKLVTVPQQFHSWIVQPRVAGAAGEGLRAQLQRLSNQASLASLLIGSAIAAAVLLLAEFLLALFGPGISDALPILAVLVLVYFLELLGGPIRDLLVMRGHEHASAQLAMLCAGTEIGLQLLLLPTLGVTGVIWAMGVAVSVHVVLGTWLVWRFLRVRSGLPGLLLAARRPGGEG
jgi:O-antigen/teichoic acid export membrane protein